MSIASELNNLEGNIEDSYDAVNDMGGIIPAQRNMDNLDQAIRTIPQNTGTTYTAGTGIDITSDVISVDNTTVPYFSDLATVATTGDYSDLINTPTIPAAQVQSDWAQSDSTAVDYIKNKPIIPSPPTQTSDLTNDGDDGVHPFLATDDVATVATSGLYSDLTGTPTIPTKTSDLVNDGADNTSTYVEADDLAAVATSGLYSDLTGTPTIPAAQIQSDWTQATTTAVDYIKNKPTIPTVNNATLTIQKNGTTVKTFTANASTDVTANITVPTKFSDLTGTVATAQIADGAVTKAKTDDSGLKNPSVSGAYCYYRRSGHFVWVSGNASGFALTAGSYKTMFTLPSGYRPPIDIYCPLGLSSATKMGILRIRTSGEVQGWADTNTSYWNFSTTFAIN